MFCSQTSSPPMNSILTFWPLCLSPTLWVGGCFSGHTYCSNLSYFFKNCVRNEISPKLQAYMWGCQFHGGWKNDTDSWIRDMTLLVMAQQTAWASLIKFPWHPRPKGEMWNSPLGYSGFVSSWTTTILGTSLTLKGKSSKPDQPLPQREMLFISHCSRNKPILCPGGSSIFQGCLLYKHP